MRLFDADNRYYETRDAFTRYIDPAFRERTVRPVVGADGVERIMIESREFNYHPIHYLALRRDHSG